MGFDDIVIFAISDPTPARLAAFITRAADVGVVVKPTFGRWEDPEGVVHEEASFAMSRRDYHHEMGYNWFADAIRGQQCVLHVLTDGRAVLADPYTLGWCDMVGTMRCVGDKRPAGDWTLFDGCYYQAG